MVTETELLNFLMAYYPQLKFVLSYGRHGTLYSLLDRRNSNQILSKVNFDEFEKYLKLTQAERLKLIEEMEKDMRDTPNYKKQIPEKIRKMINLDWKE